MDPTSDKVEYIEFEFDSFDAVKSYDQQYYTTDYPLFHLGKPMDRVRGFKVVEAQVPFTWYIFNTYNNTFYLQELFGGGPPTLVTIPIGNYNSVTILPVLAAALSAASTNGFVYTVTYSSSLMKLTVTSNSMHTGDAFDLIFGTSINDVGDDNPRLALGFSGGNNFSSVAPNPFITGPSVVQLTGPNYVYLNSHAFGRLVHMYLPGDGVLNPTLPGSIAPAGTDGPQMAKIPQTASFGGVCNWKDPTPWYFFDSPMRELPGNIDMFLTLGTNTFQRPLQLNGASFSVKIAFLLTQTQSSSDLGGGAQNNRVQTLSWPVRG